jgi:hypothetical protein
MTLSTVSGQSPQSTYDNVLDPQLRLALLIGEQQDASLENEHEELKAARAERRHQLEEEVKSLRAAASSGLTGALVSVGLTVSGEALGAWGDIKVIDDNSSKSGSSLLRVGKGLSASANPIGAMVTNEKDHDADGAAARLKAEDANWRADDIKDHMRKVESLQESILERAAQTARDTQSSTLSLINRI